MIDKHNHWEFAERFVAGNLSYAEQADLEKTLADDPHFAADFDASVNMIQSLQNSGRQHRFRNMLSNISRQVSNIIPKEVKVIPLRTHYWRTAGIAAGIAIITTLSTFWITAHNQKKTTNQYNYLRRELEHIKTSQKQIISRVNEQNTAPMQPANFSGTGFAVRNDGYLITNFHVTEGADSVYIQDSKGNYYKASVISFDEQADVALLKIARDDFEFSKQDVPYTFASGKRGLGSRVFTLGFPQDEIVYSEGYISGRNGFQGDSLQYQLELPASFGQSGAPVLDAQGNVIAIVTAKQGEGGNTYAVSSRAVQRLLKNLPDDMQVTLPKINKLSALSREQQIEKLQAFTCSVKVYKTQ